MMKDVSCLKFADQILIYQWYFLYALVEKLALVKICFLKFLSDILVCIS